MAIPMAAPPRAPMPVSPREDLVTRYLPLARNLARRYARSSEPYEDLVQVASLALISAVDRFDPDRGVSFPSFAIPTILGALRRHFRDCTWSVHVPRTAQERALAVGEASEQLSALHGRAPTVNQLAAYLEMDIEDVLDGLHARQAYETESFDVPCRVGDRGGDITLGETLGAEDEHYELVEEDATVAQALKSLSDREREILRLRFYEEMTQSEIAKRVGVSQMQVSRLLRRSLGRLREIADADSVPG